MTHSRTPVEARVVIDAVERVRPAYEQVADQLRARIVSGEITTGARLPLEAELARRFGVSRPTVREALRSLAAQRLIRTARGPGGGNFVTPPTVGTVSDLVESSLALITEARGVSLHEFLEAREVLEARAARFAAERRTEEHVERLYALIPVDPSQVTTEDQFTDNRDFHAAVLTAADNTLLYLAAQPIFSVLQNNLERSRLGANVHSAINDQHRELAALIDRGDGAGAEAAMRHHLEYLRPAYERAWIHRTDGDGC